MFALFLYVHEGGGLIDCLSSSGVGRGVGGIGTTNLSHNSETHCTKT